MVTFPRPDRLDYATLALVGVLLLVAHVIYPRHLVQVSVWLSIVIIFICWSGYFFYKLVYDDVEFW